MIRVAHETDLPDLMALYRETVLAKGPQHYTPAQAQVWASFGANYSAFRQFIRLAFGIATPKSLIAPAYCLSAT